MDEPAPDTALTLRPILVFRSKVARPSVAAALKTEGLAKQFSVATQYAAEKGVETEPYHYVIRTGAHYRPMNDRKLMRVIGNARSGSEILVLDDVFRLVDFRDPDTALSDVAALASSRAPLFSVLHGLLLWKMPPKFINAQLVHRVRAYRARSRSVKSGIARYRTPGDGPSPNASRKGAQMKRRIADDRARQLIAEIERIRSSLAGEERSNRSAIARALNLANVPTPSGRGRWQGITVRRVFDRTASAVA